METTATLMDAHVKHRTWILGIRAKAKATREAHQASLYDAELLTKHRGLIHTFAKRGFARLCAAGVEVEYDDCAQEVSFSLLKASKSFDHNLGITFGAYFGRAAYNNFNKLAERLINDQLGLGLVRQGDLKGVLEDDGVGDLVSMIPDNCATPDQALDHRQQQAHSYNGLSESTRQIVDNLASPSQDLREQFDEDVRSAMAAREAGTNVKVYADMTIGYIGRHLGLNPMQMSAARKEIKRVCETHL